MLSARTNLGGNIAQNFTGPAGPVNKKITGPRQFLLALGQQASAKLYTAYSLENMTFSKR